MCGRYALFGPVSRHTGHFGLQGELDLEDRYNIAPTQAVPVIRASDDGLREVVLARWGLLPAWVKDPGSIAHPINAKAETAGQKPMFRHAFRKSRVLVPASGFYEWKGRAGSKQPYFIRLKDGEPMGLGGLLERWTGPDGVQLSCCILTVDANELLASIHERMPVIIRPEDYDAWLDPGLTDIDIVGELIDPYPAEAMEAYPVGRAVGNPESQGPVLVEPVAGPP